MVDFLPDEEFWIIEHTDNGTNKLRRVLYRGPSQRPQKDLGPFVLCIWANLVRMSGKQLEDDFVPVPICALYKDQEEARRLANL